MSSQHGRRKFLKNAAKGLACTGMMTGVSCRSSFRASSEAESLVSARIEEVISRLRSGLESVDELNIVSDAVGALGASGQEVMTDAFLGQSDDLARLFSRMMLMTGMLYELSTDEISQNHPELQRFLENSEPEIARAFIEVTRLIETCPDAERQAMEETIRRDPDTIMQIAEHLSSRARDCGLGRIGRTWHRMTARELTQIAANGEGSLSDHLDRSVDFAEEFAANLVERGSEIRWDPSEQGYTPVWDESHPGQNERDGQRSAKELRETSNEENEASDACSDVTCPGSGHCAVVRDEPVCVSECLDSNEESGECSCEQGYHPISDSSCMAAENMPHDFLCRQVECGQNSECVVEGGQPRCECESGFIMDEESSRCVEPPPPPAEPVPQAEEPLTESFNEMSARRRSPQFIFESYAEPPRSRREYRQRRREMRRAMRSRAFRQRLRAFCESEEQRIERSRAAGRRIRRSRECRTRRFLLTGAIVTGVGAAIIPLAVPAENLGAEGASAIPACLGGNLFLVGVIMLIVAGARRANDRKRRAHGLPLRER